MNKEIVKKVLDLAGSNLSNVKIVVDLFAFMNSREELIEVCAINVGRLHMEAYNLLPHDEDGCYDDQKYKDIMNKRDFYLEIIKSI